MATYKRGTKAISSKSISSSIPNIHPWRVTAALVFMGAVLALLISLSFFSAPKGSRSIQCGRTINELGDNLTPRVAAANLGDLNGAEHSAAIAQLRQDADRCHARAVNRLHIALSAIGATLCGSVLAVNLGSCSRRGRAKQH